MLSLAFTEAEAEHLEADKPHSEIIRPLALGRLDSTNTTNKTEAEFLAESGAASDSSESTDTGSRQRHVSPASGAGENNSSSTQEETSSSNSVGKDEAETPGKTPTEEEEAGESSEGEAVSVDESKGAEPDKTTEDAEMGGPDAQRNEHPHPSSPEGSGATSVVVIVVRGPNPVLIVANAGDSRCVISRRGVVSSGFMAVFIRILLFW